MTHWIITQEAFDKLLAQLDADRESAAEKYEQIRQKLTKFFQWRGCLTPDECVDLAIDRGTRRIAEGVEITTRDPYLYFHGVAINVLREYWKDAARNTAALEDLSPAESPAEDPLEQQARAQEEADTAQRLACLDMCLKSLSSRNLEIIRLYHQGTGGDRIKSRKALAARLGIELNALRIRAYRIREELEGCVSNCAKNSAKA